ncbi:DUF4845 domain-containing protein [Azovibrio restrictus]|uniref:DUF4845 domain-containing protein n=1 Tax=Azovibrio restrictus TaxID=146938 RepID=UPI0026EB115A|nr:DUF4845 domain-containing protein [Azovibrio restrictus]
MKRQAGLALGTLIIWCVVIALVALVGMKLVPAFIEYQSLLKTVKTVVSEAPVEATVADIRKAFSKYDQINDFPSVDAQDLEITKEAGQLVVSFSYEKRVPLVANISLVIDFRGSSN